MPISNFEALEKENQGRNGHFVYVLIFIRLSIELTFSCLPLQPPGSIDTLVKDRWIKKIVMALFPAVSTKEVLFVEGKRVRKKEFRYQKIFLIDRCCPRSINPHE